MRSWPVISRRKLKLRDGGMEVRERAMVTRLNAKEGSLRVQNVHDGTLPVIVFHAFDPQAFLLSDMDPWFEHADRVDAGAPLTEDAPSPLPRLQSSRSKTQN